MILIYSFCKGKNWFDIEVLGQSNPSITNIFISKHCSDVEVSRNAKASGAIALWFLKGLRLGAYNLAM